MIDKQGASERVRESCHRIRVTLLAIEQEMEGEYLSATYIKEKTNAIRGRLLQIERVSEIVADDV